MRGTHPPATKTLHHPFLAPSLLKHCSAVGARALPGMRTMLSVGLLVLSVLTGQASTQLTPDWSVRRAGVDGFFFGFDLPVHMVTDSAGAVYVTSAVDRTRDTDILTIKYAPDGTELWSVRYHGPSGRGTDVGLGIAIDSAGDILMLGRSECGFLVVKYDPLNGAVIWTSLHDTGNCPEQANAMTTDDGGNIYVTGYTWPPGTDNQKDFYTYKLDSLGNVIWTATYDGPGNPFLFGYDEAVDIALDSNGDVLVTGPSNDANGQTHFATIKYRGTDGAQLWLARLDLPDTESVALLISPENDVYVTGAKVNGMTPFVTAKYDGTNGSQMWLTVQSMGAFGHTFGMALDSIGDVYVTGRIDPDWDRSTSNENVVTMRLQAADGVLQWLSTYGQGGNGIYDEGRAIVIDDRDNVFVSGSTRSFGTFGALLLQYDAATGQIVDQGTFELPIVGATGQVMGLDAAQNIIVAGATSSSYGYKDILTLKYPNPAAPPSPWTDLGSGLAGTGGVTPLLVGTGTLQPGTPVDLTLSNALPSSQAWLFIGLSDVNVPFMGGTLVPSPDFLLPGLPVGGSGGLVVGSNWPAVASGTSIYFQYWIADPAGPFGASASNGVLGMTP